MTLLEIQFNSWQVLREIHCPTLTYFPSWRTFLRLCWLSLLLWLTVFMDNTPIYDSKIYISKLDCLELASFSQSVMFHPRHCACCLQDEAAHFSLRRLLTRNWILLTIERHVHSWYRQNWNSYRNICVRCQIGRVPRPAFPMRRDQFLTYKKNYIVQIKDTKCSVCGVLVLDTVYFNTVYLQNFSWKPVSLHFHPL